MSRIAAQIVPHIDVTIPLVRDGAIVFEAAAMPGTEGLAGRSPCVLVPGEQALAVVVDLPLASHRQRLDAVGFAVEGLLAEPLSKVHVALGPQIAPKRYLAVMVSHAAMEEWAGLLGRAGLSQARLLPDFLALPSVVDDGWTVFASGDRAIVRRSDLSGFSTRLSMLPAAWRLAGCPAVVSCGEPLAPLFLASHVRIAEPLAADPVAAGFTLRQSIYATSAFEGAGLLRRAGWICTLGLGLLGAINIADTLALRQMAEDRRAEAQALISKVAPNTNPQEDIDVQLGRILPDTEDDKPGRFLPLFSDVASALATEKAGLVVESLAYDAADGQFGLEVAAGNLATLQRIEATLGDAGLQVSSGVATAESGGAKVRIVVEDRGGTEGS